MTRKWLKRVLSAFMAVVLAVVGLGAFSVSASNPSITVPNSGFSYTVTTHYDSKTKNMELRIMSLNNPGVKFIGFYVTYGEDYSAVMNESGKEVQMSCPTASVRTSILLAGQRCVNARVLFASNLDDSFDKNKFEIALSFHYNGSDINQASSFSIGVPEYEIPSAVVPIVEYGYEAGTALPELDKTLQTSAYYLGDVDNDKKIEIEDASSILNISNKLNFLRKATVNDLDRILAQAAQNNYSGSYVFWKDYLSLPQGEAADANLDGIISVEDAQLTLDYNSAMSVGAPITSTVGTVRVYVK